MREGHATLSSGASCFPGRRQVQDTNLRLITYVIDIQEQICCRGTVVKDIDFVMRSVRLRVI